MDRSAQIEILFEVHKEMNKKFDISLDYNSQICQVLGTKSSRITLGEDLENAINDR